MSRVKNLKAFTLTLQRDVPYLGARRSGEETNERGYFVRKGNGAVYPVVDRSVLVRLETDSGIVGWGETYGLVAPKATTTLIDDFLADFVIGRDPFDASVIHEDLYNMMRVRGYTGGFYLDAMAAIDIALWDAAGRLAGLPIAKLLGGHRHEKIQAYVSGLPKPTLGERVEFAREWQQKGFDNFKFAAPMADEGLEAEVEALREGLGPDARIAADMHWAHSAAEAVGEIFAMEKHGLWFAEAPVATENIQGLAQVRAAVKTPIGAGEEWRTVYDAQARYDAQAIDIVQPEMGHTGITQFMRIAQTAQAKHLRILPHATIGAGIFLAASLQASSVLEGVVGHEFQHSVINRYKGFVTEGMECSSGYYRLSDGPGLGVEPTDKLIEELQ